MRRLKSFLFKVLISVTSFFVIIIVAFFAIYFLFPSHKENFDIKGSAVLELSFPSDIEDYGGAFEIKMVTYKNKEGLVSILEQIEFAEASDGIKGISLKLGDIKLGLVQIKELREKLKKFKLSGKFVYAYATKYSQEDYYLASVADSVFMNPQGILSFKGMASEYLYFKNFQEKYGIYFDVVQKGQYKGVPEMFTKSSISPEMKKQIYTLLGSLWDGIAQDLSQDRGISVDKFNQVADQGLVKFSDQALSLGFIDGLKYWDEYEGLLKNKLKIDNSSSVNYIKSDEFSLQSSVAREKDKDANLIAIVFAQGYIQDKGDSGLMELVTPDILRKSFEEIRQNDRIKAVILRVNSPGGSALASEEIWREIEVTKKKKPVIASFGDVAASGGYYIACGADKVFASPATVTGSIGVFGILPNIEELAEKHGIQSSQVSLFKKSITYSVFKKLTVEQRKDFETEVGHIYDLFLKRVSEGRKISLDKLRRVAGGRVWSGQQALKNGLVDVLGGLDDAIEYVVEAYNIPDHQLVMFPTHKIELLDMIFKTLNVGAIAQSEEQKWLKQSLGERGYAYHKWVKMLLLNTGVQALSPINLLIY